MDKKNSVIIILLGVIMIIALYCMQSLKRVQHEPKEANKTGIVEAEEQIDTNRTILETVTFYQEGYRKGCDIALEREVDAVSAEQNASTAFLLGLDRGERICRAEIKRKKSLKDDGYKDGCASAKGTVTKNEKFFKESKTYANAWTKGYEECKSKSDETPKVERKEEKKEQPKPPVNTYKKGYNDGCASARGRFVQSARLYEQDRNYRSGWNDGEEECGYSERRYDDYPEPRDRVPVRFYRY